MNRIKNLSLLLGMLIIANSCDNSIDLTAEYKDIPVVYGILSADDPVHYIKIEKAFLGDEDDNALEIAQIPDSIYYDNLDVKVERVANGEVFNLERVSGTEEGIEREDGVFAEEPNTLYKFEGELVEGAEYMLRINRGDDFPEITASTRVVSGFTFVSPQMATDITIKYRTFSLGWKVEPGAFFYDIKMNIHFLEQNPDNLNEYNERTIVWDIFDNYPVDLGGSTTIFYDIPGEEFFRFLGAELDDNGGAKRIFVSLDFVVNAGTEELYDYINIGLANTGITSSQVIPTYTNLSEGYGVFASRKNVTFEGFTLKSESRDSLANGIYTSGLGFED